MIECRVCGKEFKRKHNLRVHIASKHPEVIDAGLSENIEFKKKGDNKNDNKSVEEIKEEENIDLKEAMLHITDFCNLKCRHCYVNPSIPSKDEVKTNFGEWIKIMDKLKELGVEKVTLVGGEPTIHPEFHEILQYAIKTFQDCSIQTNGTTNTNLNDYDCNVTVSFEYLNPAKNNQIRRMTEGEFNPEKDEEKAYKLGVKKLKALDGNKTVRMTLYNDNDYLAMAKFANQLLDANFVLFPLKPVGLAENLQNKVPSTKRIERAMNDMMSLNQIKQNEIRFESPFYFMYNQELYQKFKEKMLELNKVCPAGDRRLSVQADGTVNPCPYQWNYKIGNLKEDSEKEIVKGIKKYLKKIKKIPAKDSCKNCDYWSICKGGCPATYRKYGFKSNHYCPIR